VAIILSFKTVKMTTKSAEEIEELVRESMKGNKTTDTAEK